MSLPPNSARPLFVGREREVAELRAGLRDAAAGRGRLFLVVGEAGIGKTRLLEELVRGLESTGLVLWGRCWESMGAPPYWPWVQAIRACLRGTARLDALAAGAAGPYLAQLLPELHGPTRDSTPPSTSLESEHARHYLFDGLATFWKGAARRTPLVLLLDDLQWADVPSLLLLHFVARELRDERVLLVGTYRDAEVRRSPVVAELLGALARDGRHLPLRGFSEEEVRLLIEATAGRSPSPVLARAVHRETGGNPFFVDEIVRLLVAEGALERPEEGAPARLPVPQGVRAAIRRRLAALPVSCRDALTLASVIGRDFDLACLQRACALAGEALLERLDPALASEIVVRDPHSPGRYRFAHALIREAIYEELGSADRARCHARIGDALEDLHRTDPTPHLAALAHHFLEAAPAGRADEAVAYSTRAGRHAAASLAYEDAAALFARALETLADARPSDERERCELLLARGDAQWRSGDGPGARETFRHAAELARRVGEPSLLAASALGFAGERSRMLWIQTGVTDQAAVDLLGEALDAVGDGGDPGLRARLLARLAINLYWSPQPERALALSEEAASLARRLGDARILASVLRARCVALWRAATADQRRVVADEIVNLAGPTADPELALPGYRFRIIACLERGDIAAADRAIEAWARITGELRQPLYSTDLAMWRATRAIMDGRFAEGEEQARRTLELGKRERDVDASMRYRIQTMVLRFHQGHLEKLVGNVRSRPDALVPLRCGLAFSWSETGHESEAQRELTALGQDGFRFPDDGAWIVNLSLLSAVAATLDDRRSAARLHELLLPYAERVAIAAAGLACWGSVSYYLGLLASTLGRGADAARHFEDAVAAHERMGARPFLAWTQLAYARLLLRDDAGARRTEAGALLARALTTARELGMEGLVARSRRLGLEPEASDLPREPSGDDAVFRREGDFWTLAYAGRMVRLRHGKGLGDLAILLANPGREIHVADLIASASPADASGAPARELVAQGLRVSRGVADDARLDRRAHEDYRERLAELQRELEDAERCNDAGRVTRARAERDFIAGELAAAFGLGGRGRRAGSPIERARKAVAARIRFSLAHLARVHPALAQHLRLHVRTGTLCTYVVPDEPVSWRL